MEYLKASAGDLDKILVKWGTHTNMPHCNLMKITNKNSGVVLQNIKIDPDWLEFAFTNEGVHWKEKKKNLLWALVMWLNFDLVWHLILYLLCEKFIHKFIWVFSEKFIEWLIAN